MRVEPVAGVGGLGEAAWRVLEPEGFPFFDHEFLRALERSGSIGGTTGWSPVFLVCKDGSEVLGALPLYLRTDSYGEYVFDWEWARAYREHGLRYYPKLVSAVPFTPATGSKLLVRPGVEGKARAGVVRALLDAAGDLEGDLGASSTHALFLPEGELGAFEGQGYAVRHSMQFHWRNGGYGEFADYLGALTGKRRRQVVRERRQLGEEGVEIQRLTGEDLRPEHAALMHRFYLHTHDRKWGSPYLTAAFFDEVFRTMKDRIVLVLARGGRSRWLGGRGRTIAGSLFFHKGENLYGRYWGATEGVRNLHFELCYYAGIEFAIERGMRLFEAGAQGEHKLARGFLPTITYSAHHIAHPGFRQAISRYLADERRYMAESLAEYARHDPYAKP